MTSLSWSLGAPTDTRDASLAAPSLAAIDARGTPSAASGGTALWFSTFEEFVAVRGPRLVRCARVILQNDYDADDVAAEVFAKVHERWKRILHLTAPDAYINKILVNMCHDLARKKRRRRETIVEPSLLPELGGSLLPGAIDGMDVRDEMAALLSQLSTQQRTVIVLRYYMDMDDVQIAAAMKVQRPTVRWHAREALTNLRRMMKGTATGGLKR